MDKTVRIIFIVLLVLLDNLSLHSEETAGNKNILILYSLAPSTPAYRVLTDGIRNKLTEAYGDAYNLHMEYLETERYPKSEYPKERFDLYNEKYNDVPLDLLICVGIDIIETVKKNADAHLLNLPAITIDFDLTEYGMQMDLKAHDRTTVIGMTLNVPETVNSAMELFPGRTRIYFISGISRADQMYLQATKAASAKFDPRKNFTYVSDISMDDVLDLVRILPDSSLIFIPGFNVDSKGVPYYNPESVRLISQAANAPVFTYSDMGFGDGAIGGYILSFKKIGLLAGQTAVQILNGADPASIIITENDIYDYIFDWRELKRWDLLNSSQLPKGSKVQFEEINFFERYRLIILFAILFLIIQSLLIIKLLGLYRKQRLITGQLIDSENKFRDLVREDRILRLGQLTASLSHELNQPLTAILATAQAGIRFINSNNMDPEILREIFQNIVEDDKRTSSILSSIRGMMKLEKREKEKVELNDLIEEVCRIYQSEALEKRVKLEPTLADKPVYIIADPIQIQQVIMNLIVNAIQSVEKENEQARQVVIVELPDEENVTVSVRDYGRGIDESIKDKLFKPFVTSRKEGLGIGLAISRSIIDNHQGKIWAENMEDGGAKFSFSLKIFKDGQGNM
jgi:signal transduction histidine kinase